LVGKGWTCDSLDSFRRSVSVGGLAAVCISNSVQTLLSSSLLSKNLKNKIYKSIILPVVLYGCETWSLILREERRLRVFENRMLRRMFGSKRDEVTGEWRKLNNTELNDLYSSPKMYCLGDKIEKNEMSGQCSANGGEERRLQGFGRETWGKETTWKTQA